MRIGIAAFFFCCFFGCKSRAYNDESLGRSTSVATALPQKINKQIVCTVKVGKLEDYTTSQETLQLWLVPTTDRAHLNVHLEKLSPSGRTAVSKFMNVPVKFFADRYFVDAREQQSLRDDVLFAELPNNEGVILVNIASGSTVGGGEVVLSSILDTRHNRWACNITTSGAPL